MYFQVDETPIPLLFMRTVIQAIDAFPKLVRFFPKICYVDIFVTMVMSMLKSYIFCLQCENMDCMWNFHFVAMRMVRLFIYFFWGKIFCFFLLHIKIISTCFQRSNQSNQVLFYEVCASYGPFGCIHQYLWSHTVHKSVVGYAKWDFPSIFVFIFFNN